VVDAGDKVTATPHPLYMTGTAAAAPLDNMRPRIAMTNQRMEFFFASSGI
jgi:hypothetical protein